MQIVLFWSALVAIGTIAIIMVIMMIQFNAASESSVIRALKGIGYTNIQMVEKQNMLGLGVWQGCDISDNAKFVGSATNASGASISMYVCVSGERASVHF
jgi:hypothetical protein